MRIAIKTLGCKSNRYESDRIFEKLRSRHEVFELNEGARRFSDRFSSKSADLLIVNTCTVTHSADRKSRQAVRSFKSVNPLARVLVFGCGANVAGSDYESMREVDYVVSKPDEVFRIVEELSDKNDSSDCELDVVCDGERTRAPIKIQDGCNRYCTYCIIPRARGQEVSFNSQKILKEVKEKEAAGFQEIVLTGIIISEWKEEGMDLADLCEMLIEQTNIPRFRLSSLEPKDFSEKFVNMFKTGRLCPHLHMSLQSGSDSVLKRMRRQYVTEDFYEVCQKFRKYVPDLGFTTDVIVGFPGETDKEFNETLDFVKKINFLKVHVFPFSKRKDTAAYHMKDQISEQVKKARARGLRDLTNQIGNEFKKNLLGNEYDVLVETCEDGICKGFTPNYIPVQFQCAKNDNLFNKIVKIKLDSSNVLYS